MASIHFDPLSPNPSNVAYYFTPECNLINSIAQQTIAEGYLKNSEQENYQLHNAVLLKSNVDANCIDLIGPIVQKTLGVNAFSQNSLKEIDFDNSLAYEEEPTIYEELKRDSFPWDSVEDLFSTEFDDRKYRELKRSNDSIVEAKETFFEEEAEIETETENDFLDSLVTLGIFPEIEKKEEVNTANSLIENKKVSFLLRESFSIVSRRSKNKQFVWTSDRDEALLTAVLKVTNISETTQIKQRIKWKKVADTLNIETKKLYKSKQCHTRMVVIKDALLRAVREEKLFIPCDVCKAINDNCWDIIALYMSQILKHPKIQACFLSKPKQKNQSANEQLKNNSDPIKTDEKPKKMCWTISDIKFLLEGVILYKQGLNSQKEWELVAAHIKQKTNIEYNVRPCRSQMSKIKSSLLKAIYNKKISISNEYIKKIEEKEWKTIAIYVSSFFALPNLKYDYFPKILNAGSNFQFTLNTYVCFFPQLEKRERKLIKEGNNISINKEMHVKKRRKIV